MSDTQKAPLWKQLLGALAGATVAFVLYQGYTFTADHLVAGLIMDGPRHVRPTGTLESPSYFGSASSSSVSSVAAAASSQSSSDRAFLGPFGTIRGLKKFFRFGVSSSSSISAVAAVPQQSSASTAVQPQSPAPQPASASSSSVAEQLPELEVSSVPSEPTPAPIVASVVASQSKKLPKSGFGLDVVAVVTLGAVIGKRRAKRA